MRIQHAHGDADERGLARAVAAQQPDYFARPIRRSRHPAPEYPCHRTATRRRIPEQASFVFLLFRQILACFAKDLRAASPIARSPPDKPATAARGRSGGPVPAARRGSSAEACAQTNVPRPRCVSIYPSASSSSYAFFTVSGAITSCSLSSRCDFSFSPGFSRPPAMRP